eukprot:PITA_23988
MWTTLTNVYQSSNENREMVLKEKLKAIKIAKTESATAYLTKITSVRDELTAIGEIIAPIELVRIALNGLPKTSDNFVDGIVARENLPNWERLWDDFIQNEIKNNHLGAAKQVEEDDNVALLARGKKGRARKQASNSGGKGKEEEQERERQTHGNFCRDRKLLRELWSCEATSARSLAIHVQRECAFPATSEAYSSIWYVNSGASRHMTRVREYFSELSEGDTDMEVVLADDNIVRAVSVGALTFDRGLKPPLKVSDVLYVPRMKNLISVSTLEDRGYDVSFKRGDIDI